MQKFVLSLIKDRSTLLISSIFVLAAFFSLGITKLELEYSIKSWFRSGDQYLLRYESFREHYGPDSNLIMMVKFKDKVSTPKNIKTLQNIEKDLWEIKNIVRIESLVNFNRTTAQEDEILINPIVPESYQASDVSPLEYELKNNPELRNYLISKDLRSTVFYAYPRSKVGFEGKVAKGIVRSIQKSIIPKYPEVEIYMTGGVRMGEAFETATLGDFAFLIPLAFLLMSLILWIFLRNTILVILSMGLVAITVLSTLGIQGWLGVKLGLVTAMCPLTVMAICVMDLVHVLSGYKKHNNILLGIESNLKPTLLTSLTTMIGFLSFITAELYPIANLGIVSSIGIALAWVYTIFLIGPMLYLIPLKLGAPKATQAPQIFDSIYELTQRAPKTIIVFFIIITAVSLRLSFLNPIDSNVQNYFSSETEFAKATQAFKDNIGASNAAEIVLKSPTDIKDPLFLKKADQFIHSLEKRSDISKAVSLIHPLKEVHKVMRSGHEAEYKIADTKDIIAQELFFLDISLAPEKSIRNFHSIDSKNLRVSIFWHNESSAQIKSATREVEQLMKDHGLEGYVTGVAPLILGIDEYIVESFIESMLIATTVIALFMMIVFKSVFIGLLSILPNIIVPSFGAAILFLMDKPFDTSSVLVFSICLGIAIDDTIYFITRAQEQLDQNLSVDQAIKVVLLDAGKTLSLTTFILVSVFSLFYLGSFTPNHNFAIATVTVLSFALILDLVFLPCIMTVFFGRGRMMKPTKA